MKSELNRAIQEKNTDRALELIAQGADLSIEIYNAGIKNPEIAKALMNRLYRGEHFPSLKIFSMFSLPVAPNRFELAESLVREYGSYQNDIKFLKESSDKLKPLSSGVAQECGGIPVSAMNMFRVRTIS